jgi:hypothetical protein
MAKVNPPRKRGVRVSDGIPFRSDRFYGKKRWKEMSDSEFQLAVGATRFSSATRFLIATTPFVLGGLLLMAGINEVGIAFWVCGLILLALYGLNRWLETNFRQKP